MSLPILTGTKKQKEWASSVREKAVSQLWSQGFHGTVESFDLDAAKLPTDASWWIKNRASAYESARVFLGLEYNTPAGADY